jgi:YlmC/YmxH family sporulation protein
MQRINTVELAKKEIINLCGGGRLGYASEVEFDVQTACILSLLIPCGGGLFSFGKTDYLRIPWRCVECIGEDTVLVRMSENEIASNTHPLCDCDV